MSSPLRIATRGSELALWQARTIEAALRAADRSAEVSVRVVHTVGDRVLDVPLAKIGDRGLFTKEIDAALLAGEADLAVHSLKDVPTRLPDGLVIAAITEREDPRDVLLCRDGVPPMLRELPEGARVGTSSLRRQAQLLAIRPDVNVVDLRGNLNTRLARLDAGDYDAIVLAAAGVIRLGWRERISEYLDPPDWLPAVGQGALAVVCRDEDARARSLLRTLRDPIAATCTAAERAFLRRLEGGCQIPIGALARVDRATLHLDGLIAKLDGTAILRGRETGPAGDPGPIGKRLAERLLRAGGDAILASIREVDDERVPRVAAP